MQEKTLSIQEHFSDLTDPRILKKTAHSLNEIITITICAVICGADTWADVELFGKSKQEWLRKFLALPNGIPSHDTFGRVFALLSTQELERCFISWVTSIAEQVEGVIAIDGKTIRRSYDRSSGKKAIHMISAWATNNQVVLGQLKTEEKSNEITAIPQLLNLLEIKGAIVTIDAMGCQKEIAEKVVEKEGDYILAVKRNQRNLHDEIHDQFQAAHENNFDGLRYDSYESEESSHGRHEIRRCWTMTDLSSLAEANKWPKAKMIGMIETECRREGKDVHEIRFYISSTKCSAEEFAKVVRAHWGIENSLHWVLDVAFREDESRMRNGNSAENFSMIRRLALNLIKQEKSIKNGVKGKRLRAGWDEEYFLKILSA